MLFYVLFVPKCVLPPGDNPIAVNKYISYHNIYRSIQYHILEDIYECVCMLSISQCNKQSVFLFMKITLYSETCLNRTPYIPETWTNGK